MRRAGRNWARCGLAAVLAVGLRSMTAGAGVPCDDWPAYRTFVAHDVQDDGRVIDRSTSSQQSTSEGQSYGMFFALVANDRAQFDRMLAWTGANLSGGELSSHAARLPAWQWGRRPDGSFGVLDGNAAADADLWLAYDLFQAGRLWRNPGYTALARALAKQIAAQEIVDLAGLGPMLLPGPKGFLTADLARLNPSYLPLPLLRALAREMPDGPWGQLAENAFTLIVRTAPRGFAPDWAAYRAGQGFVVDPVHGDTGSYDAIRVYLWAGLTSPADPLAKPWLAALGGMTALTGELGAPPEKVASTTGQGKGHAPLGFWGALLPYFMAQGATREVALAREALAREAPTPATPRQEAPAVPAESSNAASGSAVPAAGMVYYDRVLTLFGLGAAEGRYRLDTAGRLVPRWGGKTCRSSNVGSR